MSRTAIKKTRVTAKHVAAHRAKATRDLSPKWDGCETWDADKFMSHFRESMSYYNINHSGKDLKPKVIDWMSRNGYTKDQIKAFKSIKDWRSNLTMGSIAACLLRGMQPVRSDFNNGKNTAQWLGGEIARAIEEGKNDVEPEPDQEKASVPVISIQERVRDAALSMTDEITDTIENFCADPESFDPKAFKISNLLKGKQAKAAHARIIRDYYKRQHDEYVELQEGKCDQLKEGYSHLTKSQIKKISSFYAEILGACDMLMQEAKVNKKPRTRKAVPAEKIVAKLKYKKTEESLKLVSISPTEIVGAKELWIYNTKTRKLGKYIASEFNDLGVKGTTIIGFDEHKSVQKTLRKPAEQLKAFKDSGKVSLRKFLDDINAVDTKMNGRINDETILLKVQ